MSVAINCNFARVAIRVLTKEHGLPKQKVTSDTISKIHHEFSQQFDGNEGFAIDLPSAKKRFPAVNKIFNRPWNDKAGRLTYETAFSPKAWKALPKVKKSQHSLGECKACQLYHSSLTSLFPAKDAKSKPLKQSSNENITILTTEGTTQNQIGKQNL